MAKNNNLGDFLKDVADGIRAKKGTTALINAQNFRSEIDSISTLPAGVSVNGTEITIDTDQYTAVIAGQNGDDQTGKVVITGIDIPVELDPNNDSSVQVTNLTPGNVKKNITILGVTGTLESGGASGTTLKGLLDFTKSARGLFYGYSGSTIPDGIIAYSDTSNVTNMNGMFNGCSLLTTIPLLDTANVTSMSGMFDSCSDLTSIPQLNTSNVTSMDDMFNLCSNLTTIPLLDTSKVTNMARMFVMCTKLTSIPQLNTSNVTTMQYMFNRCSSLSTIPQLNTSKVINMYSAFSVCTNLTTVPLLDTSNVENMSFMFSGCTSLTTIPAFDASKVTHMVTMFDGCTNLKSILMTNIGINLNISASTKFERSDLLTILNNLKTVTETQTLTMGETNLAKLTDEDKAIAINKG